jgi:hypothetical protein
MRLAAIVAVGLVAFGGVIWHQRRSGADWPGTPAGPLEASSE